MKKFNISAIAIAVGFAFSPFAMAQTMSKDQYGTHKAEIAAEFKTGKGGCDSLSANAKDICMAEIKGKEKVAKADLEARYKPSSKNTYDLSVARADADYAVAKEKCDDRSGNVKDVCIKEAKSAQTAAKADAKAQMKTTGANAVANEKSAKARQNASEKKVDARKDASADKRDAEYAVAKEKCDAFAGGAKDKCMADAKAHYGKS